MSKKGLFLDLDGTLADSVAALEGVYRAFLGQFGILGNAAEFAGLNGPPIPRVVEILKTTHSLAEPQDRLCELYLSLLKDAHKATPPVDGAGAVLAMARERGWIVAVVTSGGRAASRAWLDVNGFSALVAEVIGGDDVAYGKPDPEPYLLALARTGASREHSLAVEDSVQGATSALAAGLPTRMIATVAPAFVASQPGFRGVLPTLSALLPYLA